MKRRILMIFKKMYFDLNTKYRVGVDFPGEIDWGVHILNKEPDFLFECWDTQNLRIVHSFFKHLLLLNKKDMFFDYKSKILANMILKKQDKFDSIFCTSNLASSTVINMRLQGLIKAKVICLLIGVSDKIEEFHRKKIDINYEKLNLVDLILVLDNSERDYLKRILTTHVETIQFGIDSEFWSKKNGDLNFKPYSNQNYVFSAGRDPLRDWYTLLDACKYPLVIVAPRIDKSKIDNSNLLLWKETSLSEYRRLLASAKLVVVSTKDSFRASGMNVVFQAMAMGKAVITTATRSKWWYKLQQKNAIVAVKPSDVSAMKLKIDELWNNNGLRYQIGVNARKYIIKYGNVNNFIISLKRKLIS